MPTAETWFWPQDEGLFLKIIGEGDRKNNVYAGRGAGWFDSWELYMRFADFIGSEESALDMP